MYNRQNPKRRDSSNYGSQITVGEPKKRNYKRNQSNSNSSINNVKVTPLETKF